MHRDSNLNKLYLFLALTILALLGNYFSFPLFFGVDAIFGSIAIMIAVVRLGMLPAAVVAAIGGSVTLLLWGHPYALIIFVAEALFVGGFRRRVGDLVRTDATFWIFVGVPLVFLFYAGSLSMEMPQTWMIVMKQSLNGIFNALIAAIILIVWDSARHPNKTFQIGNLIQLAIFTAVLMPAFVLLAVENRSLKSRLETTIFDELKITASNIERQIRDEVTSHNMTELAEAASHTHEHMMSQPHVSWRVRNDNNEILLQSEEQQDISSGELRHMGEQMMIWLPNNETLSAMNRWKLSRYRYLYPLNYNDKELTLEVEHAAGPIINELHQSQIQMMVILSAIMIIAGGLAIVIGRMLSLPIVQLSKTTQQLINALDKGVNVIIPGSRLTEVNQLAQQFRHMSASLSDAFQELTLLASRDELTGIYNRRLILEHLADERLRAQRYGEDFCVVFYDIDQFKDINDRLGHAIGDEVLNEVTGVIGGQLRKTDIFGRWGGDEFISILPHTDLQTAIKVGEKIRETIASTEFSSTNGPVTISIGVAEFSGTDSIEQLINNADNALYKAKSEGRNRVCAFDTNLDQQISAVKFIQE